MILNVIKYGFFALLCVFGLVQTVLYLGFKKQWNLLPEIDATITDARLFDHTDSGGFRTYEAKISFVYSFEGQTYESDTPALRSPQLFPLYGYEWGLLDRYKVGETHKIRVYPDFPEMAYLEIAPLSKLSTILLPLIILGYFGYLIGVGFYISKLFDLF